MSNIADRIEAVRQLRKYGNVASIDDFMLRALQGSEGTGVDEAAWPLQPDAQIFSLITDISDGGLYTNEMSQKADEITAVNAPAGASGIEIVQAATRASETRQAVKNMFFVTAPTGITGEFGGALSTEISLNDVLGSFAGSSGTPGPCTNPTAPSKAQPTMSLIQVLPAMMNYGVKDTGAAEIFRHQGGRPARL